MKSSYDTFMLRLRHGFRLFNYLTFIIAKKKLIQHFSHRIKQLRSADSRTLVVRTFDTAPRICNSLSPELKERTKPVIRTVQLFTLKTFCAMQCGFVVDPLTPTVAIWVQL